MATLGCTSRATRRKTRAPGVMDPDVPDSRFPAPLDKLAIKGAERTTRRPARITRKVTGALADELTNGALSGAGAVRPQGTRRYRTGSPALAPCGGTAACRPSAAPGTAHYRSAAVMPPSAHARKRSSSRRSGVQPTKITRKGVVRRT
jgi:hypothetical protein